MASNVFSHVLFCGSEHGMIFDLLDQSIYVSSWVPHSEGHDLS
jgi:hypothetical protein